MTDIMIKEYYEDKIAQIYVLDTEFGTWYSVTIIENCIVRKIKKDIFRIYNSNNNNLICEFKVGGDIRNVYHQSERALW